MVEPFFELVHHHERVDTGNVPHKRVADLVLDVARTDAHHALAACLFPELANIVPGIARNHLAVVELQLLHQGEIGLLRLF